MSVNQPGSDAPVAGSPVLDKSSWGACKAFRPLVAALVFCLAGPIVSPLHAAADEWLPIAPEDLALKSNPALPGSHAMVLYSETKWDLPKQNTFYYTRIKIFDDAGRKYADVEARYGSELFSVEDLSARTIHPDGSIVEFSGAPILRQKRALSGSSLVAAFTCPAATPGSIVEYRYRLRFQAERMAAPPGIFSLGGEFVQAITRSQFFDWPVQGDLFIRQARYTLYVGETIIPGFATFGEDRPAYPRYRTANLPPNACVVHEKLGTLVCEVRDVPPLPEEAFPPPRHELNAQIEMFFTEHRAESQNEFWGRYASHQRAREEEQLSSLKLARRITEEIAEQGDTPEATLRKLYARAQQIRNRAYGPEPEGPQGKQERVLANPTAEDVLRSGEGWSWEINLAFLALARAAGFDAEMVWVAPRNRQRFNPYLFDSGQLSESAVWVWLGDTDMVLDPGTPFCSFGMLPWPKTGAGGFRITKSGPSAVTTRRLTPRDSRIERKAELQLSPDGSLGGLVQAEFYGQQAMELRIEALGMSEDERAKILTELFATRLPAMSKIEAVSAKGWNTAQDPLRAQFRVSIPARPGDGDSVEATLTATVAGQRNPFERPERVQGVSFPFPYLETDEITITMPRGTRVEQIPPNRLARLRLPVQIVSEPEYGKSTGLRRRQRGKVDVALYQNLRKQDEHSIAVARTLLVGLTDLPVEHYAKLRQFFQQVWADDAEGVVVDRSRE
jgi:transglutaminase-like putative cysteine protease